MIGTPITSDSTSEFRTQTFHAAANMFQPSLIHSPSLLLADEPTGNLDTTTGSTILELLQRLTHEKNTATIMATHSVEAAALANKVVTLRDGKIEGITRR